MKISIIQDDIDRAISNKPSMNALALAMKRQGFSKVWVNERGIAIEKDEWLIAIPMLGDLRAKLEAKDPFEWEFKIDGKID